MPATNIYTLHFAKQTAKDAIAAAPVHATNVRSSDFAPVATRNRIEETGLGRDVGDYETSLIAATGTCETYLRPAIGGYLLYGVLGAKTVSGSGPYTHVFTPANDQPYFTIWSDWGGGAKVERFENCKITNMTITAENGQSLRTSLTIMGTNVVRVASVPAGGTLDGSALIRYPGCTITTGGVENPAMQNYTLTINAAQNAQQTVEIYNSYIEPGNRTIDLNGTEVYEDRDLYDEVYYGGAGNTTLSQEVFTRTFNAQHLDANNVQRLEIDIPEEAVLTAPLPPSTNAEIARYAFTGGAERPSSGDIITIDMINSVASY